MKPSAKNRRSKRIPAAHRLLLTILGPTGLEVSKEIVTTAEVSQYGARVRGVRTLRPDSQGVLTQLKSGMQAPVRIAWQTRASSDPKYLDTGVEFLSAFDFWGVSFSQPAAQPAKPASSDAPPPVSPQALLQEFEKTSQSSDDSRNSQRARTLEAAWCGLIDQLEERSVFSRDELLASLRTIGQKFNSGQEI